MLDSRYLNAPQEELEEIASRLLLSPGGQALLVLFHRRFEEEAGRYDQARNMEEVAQTQGARRTIKWFVGIPDRVQDREKEKKDLADT